MQLKDYTQTIKHIIQSSPKEVGGGGGGITPSLDPTLASIQAQDMIYILQFLCHTKHRGFSLCSNFEPCGLFSITMKSRTAYRNLNGA